MLAVFSLTNPKNEKQVFFTLNLHYYNDIQPKKIIYKHKINTLYVYPNSYIGEIQKYFSFETNFWDLEFSMSEILRESLSKFHLSFNHGKGIVYFPIFVSNSFHNIMHNLIFTNLVSKAQFFSVLFPVI